MKIWILEMPKPNWIIKVFGLIWLASYSCLDYSTLKGHVLLPCQICIIGFFLQTSCLRILGKLDFVFGFFTLNLHRVHQQGNTIFRYLIKPRCLALTDRRLVMLHSGVGYDPQWLSFITIIVVFSYGPNCC